MLTQFSVQSSDFNSSSLIFVAKTLKSKGRQYILALHIRLHTYNQLKKCDLISNDSSIIIKGSILFLCPIQELLHTYFCSHKSVLSSIMCIMMCVWHLDLPDHSYVLWKKPQSLKNMKFWIAVLIHILLPWSLKFQKFWILGCVKSHGDHCQYLLITTCLEIWKNCNFVSFMWQIHVPNFLLAETK